MRGLVGRHRGESIDRRDRVLTRGTLAYFKARRGAA
jgi:hypothetical protein